MISLGMPKKARNGLITRRSQVRPWVALQALRLPRTKDSRLAPLFMLAALTGLRRGELCALRWTDVLFEAGQLEVSRSVAVVPGGTAEKSTKTDKARQVPLDDVAVAVLRRHRCHAEDVAAAVGCTVRPSRVRLLSRAGRGRAVQTRHRHRSLHQDPRWCRAQGDPPARTAPLHRDAAHRGRGRRANRGRSTWTLGSVGDVADVCTRCRGTRSCRSGSYGQSSQ
jgi:integrase